MNRIKGTLNKRKALVALAFTGAVAVGSGAAWATTAGSSDVVYPGSGVGGHFQPDPVYGYRDQLQRGPHRPAIGGLPSDVNGDGMISDTGDETIPNLIKAGTDDGKPGYVWIEDLFPTPARTPEELLGRGPTRQPVYEADGKTQIGWRTVPAPAANP